MKLYSKEGCGPCKTVKAYLNRLGAEYEIIDVANLDNLKELMEKYKVLLSITHTSTTAAAFVLIQNH
jgi:glutaredoxin